MPVKYRNRFKGKTAAARSGEHHLHLSEAGEGRGLSQFRATWLLYSFVWLDMKEAWKSRRAILGNPLQVPLGNGPYPNNSIKYN